MSELISSTKQHLKKLAPFARDIVIKMERRKGHYLSKIKICSKGATLHAQKSGDSFWEALDSSYGAMVKQIEKLKTRRQSHRFKRKTENC